MTTDQPANSTPPQARNRWFQFHLRTMLLMMAIAGVGFGWVGITVQRRLEQCRAIEAITAASATVLYKPHSFFGRSEWLRSILGDEVLLDVLALGVPSEFGDRDMVLVRGLTQLDGLCLTHTQVTDNGLKHLRGLTQFTSLDLGFSRVTDKGLVHLRGLPQLQNLFLDGTQVTDHGLEHLRGMTPLKHLDLGLTQVTDAGLEHLRGLTQLKILWLDGTQVTDAGLEHLRGLTQLKSLRLEGTQVTDAGVVELKKSLPNLNVNR